jgi:hypothetical protein
MFGWIKKSNINEELEKANLKGYEGAGKEFQIKIEDALKEQKNLHDLKTQMLLSDINILESIIKEKENKVREAADKEFHARQIFLKAKELIAKVDYQYKEHLKNNSRSMIKFDDIKNESEEFMKNLITEG